MAGPSPLRPAAVGGYAGTFSATKTEDGMATPPANQTGQQVPQRLGSGSADESATGALTPKVVPSSQARRTAGTERDGGDGNGVEGMGLGCHALTEDGQQGPGVLLSRLEAIRGSVITAPERRVANDCIAVTRRILREIWSECAVEQDDGRGYVTVQVTTDTWRDLVEVATRHEDEERERARTEYLLNHGMSEVIACTPPEDR